MKHAICNNMDGLEMFIPSEVSQREKDKSHMIPLLCGIFFFFKKKKRHY